MYILEKLRSFKFQTIDNFPKFSILYFVFFLKFQREFLRKKSKSGQISILRYFKQIRLKCYNKFVKFSSRLLRVSRNGNLG